MEVAERLKDVVESDHHVLALTNATGGPRSPRITLLRPNEVTGGLADGPITVIVLIDLRAAWDGLEKLYKEQGKYVMSDVAKAAGVDLQLAEMYQRDRLFQVSAALRPRRNKRLLRFTFLDLLAASVAADLRRHGIPKTVIRLVSAFLYDPPPVP